MSHKHSKKRKNILINQRSTNLENLSLKTGFRKKLYMPNGNCYWGNWLKGEKSGFGVMSYGKSLLYEGTWDKNNRLGYGRFSQYIPNEIDYELCYVGEIKDQPHGHGYCHYPDGSYFEGQFLEGRFGKGRCWYRDGSFYEGTWKSDTHDGFGMLILGNGDRFEGEWKMGSKEGRGAFYHTNKGQIQEGLWKDGIAVTSIIRDLPNRDSLEPPQIPLLLLDPNAPCLTYLKNLLGI